MPKYFSIKLPSNKGAVTTLLGFLAIFDAIVAEFIEKNQQNTWIPASPSNVFLQDEEIPFKITHYQFSKSSDREIELTKNLEDYFDSYDEPTKIFDEPDSLLEKNYKPLPVATATTGGLPFIKYALKNILWLFGVGTIFIMFVGTICAIAYRWIKANQGLSFGRQSDLEMTDFVYKAISYWDGFSGH